MKTLVVLAIVILAAPVFADSYEYSPTPADLWDLNHGRAYRWGIGFDADPAEEIVGAQLTFDNIRNWRTEPNRLWLTLIDDAPLGVSVFGDNSSSNYFASSGTELNLYENIPATPDDLAYTFNLGQLALLNTFAEDGSFALGIDPDCHFYNDGIRLWIETDTSGGDDPSVPEPSGVAIITVALGGLLVRRRR